MSKFDKEGERFRKSFGHHDEDQDEDRRPAKGGSRPAFSGHNSSSHAPRSNQTGSAGNRPGSRPAPRSSSFRDEQRPEHKPPRDDSVRKPLPPRDDFSSFAHVEPENLLSGRNPIREALKAGRDIEKLLVAKGELSGSAKEIVSIARESGIPVQIVERSRLDEITRNHQGMLAFASAYRYSTVEDMLNEAAEKNEDPFIIILDGITDPQNLGAIIRSAACVGAHGVIVPERRAAGLTPVAVKASAGAVEVVKVARVTNITRTIEQLKEAGIWLYAADMRGTSYLKTDFSGPVALVIGSEGEGVSRLVAENCDHIVSLPMSGKLDSLNASVAAGVLMYAVMAQRSK
ncbi:MAG: 23S rRNA (guanosine(2251)-2'-O)-methyltransferase RlmB [Clostridiales bacterium]|nr:23S rRNA (guanosine(2251)-2'-O)-methyltransferase RlmB [Clostridiales bacterium]